jgi:hypothetical protein
MEERLFDPDRWQTTATMNGEKVAYVETTYYADPDAMKPGDSMQEVLLQWPDGSAFRMQFYLSPAWWRGEYEGAEYTFYGAVHNLIREGFDEDVFADDATYELRISNDEVRMLANDAGVDRSPERVLRLVADLMEDGTIGK